ncbi:glycoside hydrolase family 9 protein [Alkalitalea saponilacus]|uniref:N-terminal ig-like domain of cellulase n=1 Tax=Alkalitalea saponilacus TaxID=889453 RepID=A0A1T5ACE4_9BACT|nr:glycoside hydrolase family 9 protein [Alkalitalea saponilacus]ASB48754.1 glycoside hydrolase [Alkalitalea saponilacus]SKB32634.1 N-terminal ig-like domain of cellulase [Alkalitalea saponilacus]
MKVQFAFLVSLFLLWSSFVHSQTLQLNELEYFEQNGLNVLVYSNRYNPIFFDEKTAGIELIHHGVRTATGGAVRLHHTPEQWDLVPEIVSRKVDVENNFISTHLRYADFNFDSEIKVTPHKNGFRIEVFLEKPIPKELEGRAGLNFEFLPPDYWESTYLADGKPKLFPRYPASDAQVRPSSEKIQQIFDHSTFDDRGRGEFLEPLPISMANSFVLAPENPERRVVIESDSEIMFFDGRILAQNGWYVFRSLLPSGKTGKVMEWYVEPHTIPDWVREPNIGFSQVGYTPAQRKRAIIELDKNDNPQSSAKIFKVAKDGSEVPVFTGMTEEWGRYLRYNYLVFDFSEVKNEGVYFIEYGGQRTNVFPISKDVYEGIWHPTMDVWLPIQMDHMTVREAYRIWHGNAHQDDALQAPLNHNHFDGYSMGDTTDTRFEPFERIPGLDIGGWYDAGDFDIQTGSHNAVVMDLVQIYETFAPQRDMTYVDQKTRYVDIHRPDGKNDMLQQIEHGVLALVAQIENIGHPIRGIVVGNLYQYHHLGDAATITDNLPYNPNLAPYETDGVSSGTLDDRWAFTTRSVFMDYSTAASLAAASRVLKEFNPDLSQRALDCAMKMWNDNIDVDPETMDGGRPFFNFMRVKTSAALQLFITTKEDRFKRVFEDAIWSQMDRTMFDTNRPGNFPVDNAFSYALMAYPHMNENFHGKLRPFVLQYLEESNQITSVSPYEVPMGGRGWGGNTPIMKWAINNYFIHKYYPELMDVESIFSAMDYILGCHPYSNVSFVSTIGVKSKQVTYGSNRADFTFIAGGVVPGLVLLQPDFYENKDDWPFLWGQNEAIITTATPYVFLAHAIEELAKEMNKVID